jgi:HAD superfamily hydrolase (TIGR01509 family)
MSVQVPVRGIIFDLGDVLFTWSSQTSTAISAGTFRKILSSSSWLEYECGRLKQDACYEQISQEFSIEASQVVEAFAQARESLQPDNTVVTFLKHLRKSTLVNVYAMSNVAREDFAVLSQKMDWSLFDRVFTSGEAGMRKPDPSFYCYVLEEIKLAPEQLIFIDDKRENVLAADRLGIRGILFDNSTVHTLQTLLDGPVARGYEYLYRNAKQFDSITDGGVVVQENFAELLILEATQDQ